MTAAAANGGDDDDNCDALTGGIGEEVCNPNALIGHLIYNPNMASGQMFAMVKGIYNSASGAERLIVSVGGAEDMYVLFTDVIDGKWISLGDRTIASSTASLLLDGARIARSQAFLEWDEVDWEDDHPVRSIARDNDGAIGECNTCTFLRALVRI